MSLQTPTTLTRLHGKTIADRLASKQARYAIAGNSWQNVFPTHIRDYQDWWARVQAALIEPQWQHCLNRPSKSAPDGVRRLGRTGV